MFPDRNNPAIPLLQRGPIMGRVFSRVGKSQNKRKPDKNMNKLTLNTKIRKSMALLALAAGLAGASLAPAATIRSRHERTVRLARAMSSGARPDRSTRPT